MSPIVLYNHALTNKSPQYSPIHTAVLTAFCSLQGETCSDQKGDCKMHLQVGTVLAVISLVVSLITESLAMPSTQEEYTDPLDELKQQIRNHFKPVGLSRYNTTLESRRQLLKLYRDKLQELGELDDTVVPQTHRREFHSVPAKGK